ncbi:MAG: lytic transglycosylase domain-containing protein [Natronincolaceae bacterium]|jgi:soluble lytic murein transglycosylase|nr:lytic transglycosylase domain-containing protein [Bacillota bacterium]NLK90606.1 lytic transglycosylase domain-containing protein [Clostridiales bacterium]
MLVLGKGCLRFLILVLLLIIVVIALQNIEWIIRTIYPVHYYDLVEEYAQKYEIDPYLVVAIMKNESRFNPTAVSRKGAKGLMQIAPITGKWASEELEISNYSEDMLFQPELNIHFGIWYLDVLRQEFGNNVGLMVAGYNAGNGNVRKWLSNPKYSKDGETLHKIPFGETRIYQKRVLRDYKIYTKIYKQDKPYRPYHWGELR